MSAVRLALALASALCATGPATASADEGRIDVEPALEGMVQADSWAEINLRIVSPVGGRIDVRSTEPEPRIEVSGRVEAAIPLVLPVPVWIGADGPVHLDVALPAEPRRRIDVPVRRLARNERLVAYATVSSPPAAAPGSLEGVVRLRIDARDLPTHAEAFAPIDALVVDLPTAGALDVAQLTALESYLEGCGRVVLVAPSRAVRERAEGRAGCDGALLAMIDDANAIESTLARLVTQPRPPLSVDIALPAHGAGAPTRTPLVAFFAGYALFGLLAGRAAWRPWQLFTMPLAASLVLLLAFRGRAPQASIESWTEGISGAATARFAAVLQTHGVAPGSFAFTLPALPDLPADEGAATVRLAAGDAPAHVDVRTHLLSQQSLRFRGSVAWVPTLSVAVTSDGPRVANQGDRESPAGFFLWRDKVFALPALAPAATWSVSDGHAVGAAALPPGALPLGDMGPAALLPSPSIPPTGGAVTQSIGWTAIRAREAT